jgi:fumarate hydratase subunit alpha
MRIISFDDVVAAVTDLCSQAACDLPEDVLTALKRSGASETGELAKDFFDQYLRNADLARNERLPLCQDTGFAVFFAEIGTGTSTVTPYFNNCLP